MYKHKDIEIIKKNYGENFAKLCRSLFPTLLETEDLLPNIITSKFEPNHYLYEDIVSQQLENKLKDFIFGEVDIKQNKEKTNKNVRELFNEKDYNLYECHNEIELIRFKRFYAEGEKLCTFNDEERLNKKHIFFAVKKDIENYKREKFDNPEREDEYGLSVLSIQFTKGDINTVSIISRYNHKVDNPDATYSNDLEGIIPGLTYAFEKEYNFNILPSDSYLEMKGYIKANDKKYYKYNYEINGIYYCPNNIIIDKGEVKKIDKNRYLLIDYFILDKSNKKIYLYDNSINDSFLDGLKDLDKKENSETGKLKKTIISDTVNKETGIKTIKVKPIDQKEIIIEVNKYNQIINYENPNLTTIGNNFLHKNETIQNISIPNVNEIGDHFLYLNKNLKNISLPNVINIGDFFLSENKIIENIDLRNVINIGNCCLRKNKCLTNISLPNIINIGDYFATENETLENIYAPKVRTIGSYFAKKNKNLKIIYMPSIIDIKHFFLSENEILQYIHIPNINKIGDSFLLKNKRLESIYMPNIKSIGDYSLFYNETLKNILIQDQTNTGSYFLHKNKILKRTRK